ncbi:MAG: S1C family serine protease [Actinomycetota bacterium]
MAGISEVEDTIRKTATEVGPSVVGIGRRWGLGSGVVIAPGRILTNAHNVRGDETEVTLSDGRTARARVAGVDVDGDLAILEVDTAEIPPVEWAEDAALEIGSAVVALANPGGRGLRVTSGFVSGTNRSFRGPRGRRISGSVEHTAPLLPGSSGGPLVGIDGRLIGINTNRLGEGFYLAIPADASLRERVEGLGRGEQPRRPRLGIGVAPAHVARHLRRAVGLPERDGLLVREVENGSAAERAGLREGDLIVAAGGHAVNDFDALVDALEAAEREVRLEVVRGTEEMEVTIVLRG